MPNNIFRFKRGFEKIDRASVKASRRDVVGSIAVTNRVFAAAGQELGSPNGGPSPTYSGSGGGACFTAATLVATRYGNRDIGLIELGDTVHSLDLTTGLLVNSLVEAVLVHHDVPVWRLILHTGQVIETTPEHPFFVCGDVGAGFVPAGQLQPGDELRTCDLNDAPLRVARFLDSGTKATVYNLTLAAPHHNFFAGGVLVHNRKDLLN